MKTELKVKLKAIDYTSDDDYGRDVANRNSIISNNKWIDIDNVELIIDNSTLRDIKLDIIL
jgi:pyruvate kinase